MKKKVEIYFDGLFLFKNNMQMKVSQCLCCYTSFKADLLWGKTC